MLRKALALALALLCQLTLLAPQSCAAYTDVPQNAWYHDMVNQMSQTGLLSGYQDGSFRPDNPITAAEFTAVTARAAGLSPGASSGHWAAGIMQAALEKGWYDWDELPPTGEQYDQPIPRQLAAKIAMKALAPDVWGDYNTQSQKIQDFAALEGRYYEPVLAAYQAGVLQGDDDGNFRPKEGLSRAEACAVVLRAANLSGGPKAPAQPEQPAAPVQPVQPCKGGVSENGRLQVIGTQLCNKNGQPVTLRGMSSHGMQWYGQFASAGALASLKEWGANLFRVAMYTGEGGYLSDSSLKEKAFAAVDAAVQQDLYVILDWHILSDGNPMDHAEQAAEFFTEAAQRYRDTPNVLYEICNEPNGNVSWSGQVKPYAQQVIAAIRAQDPKGVILVGSPTWSQDVHLAAQDPLEGENIMYTLHFYAGTHGQQLRDRIDQALALGAPIFVSEWGTSRADGGGGVYLEESKTWLDFLDQRSVSWCNWSLCDKGETSAALNPGANPAGGWSEQDLSASGRFVFSRFSSSN